jgi:uridine kinase
MASTKALISYGQIVEHILATPPGLGEIRLVSVDGPAGSGKTSVAERLAVAAEARGVQVVVLHMDDLYDGWDGAERGFGLLRDHVLARLADGLEGRYRRYDWTAGAYAEVHLVPATVELLIVEGVSSADRGVEPWPSLRIWVETGNAVRLDRGIERDGEALRDRWLDWMRWERDHFALERTRDRADLRVDGDPSVPHEPETELVLTTPAPFRTASTKI